MTLNGIVSRESELSRFTCHGRECRSLTITLVFSADVPNISFQVSGFRYGLSAKASNMLSARPESALARSWGDLRLVSETVDLK